MHSNAVNSVIVSGKAPTQAGAMQTTRINAHGISQAAIAQSVGVELCTAYARSMMSAAQPTVSTATSKRRTTSEGARELAELPFCELGNPMGTNAANPALLWRAADDGTIAYGTDYAVTMTTHLVLNAAPTKLTAASVHRMARTLRATSSSTARRRAHGLQPHMLRVLCNSIVSPETTRSTRVWSSGCSSSPGTAPGRARALARRR